jgi:hypothetical protein
MLAILFASVNETLQAFAKDPQWRLNGQLGIIAVLHTWSQTLLDHFHLHCLVPACAFSPEQDKWNPSRESFLFRIDSLAKEFSKRYLLKLEKAYKKNKLIFPGKTASAGSEKTFAEMIYNLSTTKWITYAKRPFAGPEQVLEYLGRYTHRVAISNNRLIAIENGQVTFTYRDRESNNEKKQCIPLIRQLIEPMAEQPELVEETIQQIMQRVTGTDITCCPQCQKGKMIKIRELARPAWDTS